MEDYRTSPWQLRDALAADGALAELEASPMKPTNARALELFGVRTEPDATRKLGDELLAAGFRYVGVTTETVEGSLHRAPHDTFIDSDDTTYVILRRRRSLLGLSRYMIATVLADGTFILSVSVAKPAFESGPRLCVRAGHDDLVRDVAEHLAFVRERALSGAKIVPTRTLDDVVRLKHYFFAHAAPADVAEATLWMSANERPLLKFAASVVLGAAALVAYLASRWL